MARQIGISTDMPPAVTVPPGPAGCPAADLWSAIVPLPGSR
jgi:hypothetical protein